MSERGAWPFMHVQKVVKNWTVSCDVCASGGFLDRWFRPLRTSQSHALAVAWAQQHALRHAELACSECQVMQPIEDETTSVTAPGGQS